MAIGEDGSDPTRGTGADKTTEASPKAYDAPPGANANEPPGSGTRDPARGGCLKFGWGCLPVFACLTLTPAGLLY